MPHELFLLLTIVLEVVEKSGCTNSFSMIFNFTNSVVKGEGRNLFFKKTHSITFYDIYLNSATMVSSFLSGVSNVGTMHFTGQFGT